MSVVSHTVLVYYTQLPVCYVQACVHTAGTRVLMLGGDSKWDSVMYRGWHLVISQH